MSTKNPNKRQREKAKSTTVNGKTNIIPFVPITEETKKPKYILGESTIVGDIFYAYVKTSQVDCKDIWTVREILSTESSVIYKLTGTKNNWTNATKNQVVVLSLDDEIEQVQQKKDTLNLDESKRFNMDELKTEEKLERLVNANIKNIWMVGEAGCGKSTMARNLSKKLNVPYHCISCGIGTSAVEFVGYKYPNRESTKFGEYYSQPSVILIDEITALDPSVGQVLNAALANDEIETTTGLVQRHKDCIIIATSNTFGSGASRQYVANNQLDASTIDRFVGGIIEVTYSEEYEAQFDTEVVDYVHMLRNLIKQQELRRIASTRLIIAGHNLKWSGTRDWRHLLIVNWSLEEKQLVNEKLKEQNNSSYKTAA